MDPASVAISRRHRRAKTDGIDGEALLRVLMAYKRGEPRVCSMLRVPAPDEEDRRRIGRERKILTAERISHVNRIKGLLFSQGISDYEPLPRDRRQRLEALRTGDGCALAPLNDAMARPARRSGFPPISASSAISEVGEGSSPVQGRARRAKTPKGPLRRSDRISQGRPNSKPGPHKPITRRSESR